MKHIVFQLKAKDVVVLLGVLVQKDSSYSLSKLAKDLKMSLSEVHQSIKRSQFSGLFDPLTRRPRRAAFEEFLLHGIPYVFPEKPGSIVEGIATSHSAPPLSKVIVANFQDKYVWPMKGGKDRGSSVTPLCRSVPEVAMTSPELYELFALVDALRVGKAREREIAKQELSARIRKI